MMNDIKQYDNACNLLAALVNKRLFDGERQWWWVADEVGGVCCFDDTDYLTPGEMKYILAHGIDYAHYAAWRDANMARLEDMDDALEALRPYLREGVADQQARELIKTLREGYYRVSLRAWMKGMCNFKKRK